MKNKILSFLALALTAISCEKDPIPAPPPVPDKYMSYTAGSTWNYELINNVTSSTTGFILTSTSRDSTSNGRSYHVFTNSGGANEYYNLTGNDYYNFRTLSAVLGGSSVEPIYLKDNAAVGANWTQSYPVTVSGIAATVTLTSTITAKGISKTVKSTTYNDVIHVTTVMTVAVGGVPLPASALVTDIQSFYSPKFGMVQTINKINFNFNGIVDRTDQLTSLISANIK